MDNSKEVRQIIGHGAWHFIESFNHCAMENAVSRERMSEIEVGTSGVHCTRVHGGDGDCTASLISLVPYHS